MLNLDVIYPKKKVVMVFPEKNDCDISNSKHTNFDISKCQAHRPTVQQTLF